MNQSREIKHVAMFLRISQEKKDEGIETLTNHREILTEYTKKKGYTFVEYGEVISGGKTELEDRVQLQKLLNDIEQFDAILVIELSRISRNGLISQTVKQYCIDYDVPIITPYDQIYDLANSDNDRLMFDVGSMIASHEHGVIGKRSKANKIQMIKSGLHVSGNVPYGYKRNQTTKKLEIDEEAAKIIRYIFELHLKGYGSYKIRDILNEEGYKSATGKVFNLPSIKRIIKNPHYKGWTVFNDRKRIKKNGKVTYKIVDTIIVEDTHPAIISKENWDLANKIRTERAEKSLLIREKPVTKSEITKLKDLIFCGCCGRKMAIRKDYKSSTGYTLKRCEYLQVNGEKCPNSGIRVIFLENELIKRLQTRRDFLAKKLKELEENGENQVLIDNQNKINQLKKRLAEVDKQDKKLIELAVMGIFTNEEIIEKKQDLINTRQRIESQIDHFSKEERVLDVESNKDKIKEQLFIFDNLNKENAEEFNRELKKIVKKIKYYRVMPEEIMKLSTQNRERQEFEAEIKVEFFEYI